ncbi:MAG: UMP kinase, partial [Xanthomonadales bacterium]|nr:UMP kinase [Xanthomonadales bacterium]
DHNIALPQIAIPMSGVVDHYDRRNAMRYLGQGDVVIFSAGTGNPFFTTDTAAALRAIEIGAAILLKATRVDGVYDSDPEVNPDAKRFESLSYDHVIESKLGVMDANAIVLCRDQDMPIRVFDVFGEGNLKRLVLGEAIGTLIH